MVGTIEGLEKCVRHYFAHDKGLNLEDDLNKQLYYTCKYDCDGVGVDKPCYNPLLYHPETKYWNQQVDEFFLKNNMITEKQYNRRHD